jgi:hypothetical protein
MIQFAMNLVVISKEVSSNILVSSTNCKNATGQNYQGCEFWRIIVGAVAETENCHDQCVIVAFLQLITDMMGLKKISKISMNVRRTACRMYFGVVKLLWKGD